MSGTGVGMSTVNSLIEAINGTFEVLIDDTNRSVEAAIYIPCDHGNPGAFASSIDLQLNPGENIRRYAFEPPKRVSSDSLIFKDHRKGLTYKKSDLEDH